MDVSLYVCMYITHHIHAYELRSLSLNISINVLNLLSLNNTIHINIYRYVLYHSKYCSSTVMSCTCTIYILTMTYTVVLPHVPSSVLIIADDGSAEPKYVRQYVV